MGERITYFDGEVGREGPSEGVVLGGALAGRAVGGAEESGAQPEGAIDEQSLIHITGCPGVEEAVEGEVDGRGRIGEG